MLYEPTNVIPSTLTQTGTVAAAEPVNIQWQVNGNSAMTMFQVDIYEDNTTSSFVYSTGVISEYPSAEDNTLPFYGKDRFGDYVPFEYTPEADWGSGGSNTSNWGLTDGNRYKLSILQFFKANNTIAEVTVSNTLTANQTYYFTYAVGGTTYYISFACVSADLFTSGTKIYYSHTNSNGWIRVGGDSGRVVTDLTFSFGTSTPSGATLISGGALLTSSSGDIFYNTDFTVQNAASAFITRTAPTLTISSVTTPLTSATQSFSATYEQAQDDSILSVRWQLFDNDDLDTAIDDTGVVYTQVLEYEYNGFFDGTSYTLSCEVETSNGITVSNSLQFSVSYQNQTYSGDFNAQIVCNEDCVLLSWDALKVIPSTANPEDGYTITDGKLYLNEGATLTWDTEYSPVETPLNYAAPWTAAWKGDISQATTSFLSNLTQGSEIDGSPNVVAFNSDGSMLVIGGEFTGYGAYFSVSGTQVTQLGAITRNGEALDGAVRAAAFSPSGNLLVIGGDFTGHASIFSISGTTLTYLTDIEYDGAALNDTVRTITFNRLGTLLVIGGDFTDKLISCRVSGVTVTPIGAVTKSGATLDGDVYSAAFVYNTTTNSYNYEDLVVGGNFTGYASYFNVGGTTITYNSNLLRNGAVLNGLVRTVATAKAKPGMVVICGDFTGYAAIFNVVHTNISTTQEETFFFSFTLAVSGSAPYSQNITLPAPNTWSEIGNTRRYNLTITAPSTGYATYFDPNATLWVYGVSDSFIYWNSSRSTDGKQIKIVFFAREGADMESPIPINIQTNTRELGFYNGSVSRTVAGTITSLSSVGGTVQMPNGSIRVTYSLSKNNRTVTARGTYITVLNASAIDTSSMVLGNTNSAHTTVYYSTTSSTNSITYLSDIMDALANGGGAFTSSRLTAAFSPDGAYLFVAGAVGGGVVYSVDGFNVTPLGANATSDQTISGVYASGVTTKRITETVTGTEVSGTANVNVSPQWGQGQTTGRWTSITTSVPVGHYNITAVSAEDRNGVLLTPTYTVVNTDNGVNLSISFTTSTGASQPVNPVKIQYSYSEYTGTFVAVSSGAVGINSFTNETSSPCIVNANYNQTNGSIEVSYQKPAAAALALDCSVSYTGVQAVSTITLGYEVSSATFVSGTEPIIEISSNKITATWNATSASATGATVSAVLRVAYMTGAETTSNAQTAMFSPTTSNFLVTGSVATSSDVPPYTKLYTISGNSINFAGSISGQNEVLSSPVKALAFNSNGNRLVVGNEGAGAFVYSIAGTAITYSSALAKNGAELDGTVNAAAFNSAGTLLAVGGGFTGYAALYSVSGNTFTYVADITKGGTALSGAVNTVAFNSAGTLLAIGGEFTGYASIYSVNGTTLTYIGDIEKGDAALNGAVNAIDFNTAGTLLAVGGSFSGYAAYFNVNGTTVTYLADLVKTNAALGNAVNSVAFNPDGTLLVIGGSFAGYASAFSVGSNIITYISDVTKNGIALSGAVNTVNFNYDGSLAVLAGDFYGNAALYSVGGRHVVYVADMTINSVALNASVSVAAFEPSANVVVLGGNLSGYAAVWDITNNITNGPLVVIQPNSLTLSRAGNAFVLSNDEGEIGYVEISGSSGNGANSVVVVITSAALYCYAFVSEQYLGSYSTPISYIQENLTSLQLVGAQVCDYIAIFDGDGSNVLQNFSTPNFTPSWNSTDYTLNLYADFTYDTNGGTSTGVGTGFRIYRSSTEDNEYKEIATLSPVTQQIKDFGIKSNVAYTYYFYAYDSYGAFMGVRTTETPIRKQLKRYSLLTATYNDDDHCYHVVKEYLFSCNLTDEELSNNSNKTYSQNFTPYPTVFKSTANYATGTLQALIGFVDKQTYRYWDDTRLMAELNGLSTTDYTIFLRDMKGHLWQVDVGTVTQTVKYGTKEMQVTISLPWTEIANANDVSIIQTQEDEGWNYDTQVLDVKLDVNINTGMLYAVYPYPYNGTAFYLIGVTPDGMTNTVQPLPTYARYSTDGQLKATVRSK